MSNRDEGCSVVFCGTKKKRSEKSKVVKKEKKRVKTTREDSNIPLTETVDGERAKG